MLKTEHPQELALSVFLYTSHDGFISGGVNSIANISDNWIQRTQSHIVVIMNYRLNIFGYPNAEGLAYANPGLSDQRKAVKWTYANIVEFGGDPKPITL